jgi:adenosylcobinamide amidohydrolase
VLFDLGDEYYALTSALHPIGIQKVRKVMVIFVDHGYDSKDPWRDALDYCSKFTDCGEVIIFMTAARNYAYKIRDWGKLIITAGIGESGENAGRTINVAVFLDLGVSVNGLVDLIRTVTEAKSGALRDLSYEFTGTVSDAVAVGGKPGEVSFLGPGTEVGRKVAKEVRQTIRFLLEGEKGKSNAVGS